MDSKIETARVVTSAGALAIYGVTLNEWVAIATLVYLLLQILVLIPKAFDIVGKWLRK